MKPLYIGCVMLLISMMNSCWSHDPPPPPPVTAACSCEEFPFPKACSSKCETGQAQIESVNAQDHTALIVIRHGAVSENQTIPLDSLPAGVPAERGASFTALLMKRIATSPSAAAAPAAGSVGAPSAASESKIVRFTKKP